MNKIPIKDLAEVMVGLVLKRKEAEGSEPKKHLYKALTLRSINPEGWIDECLLDDFDGAEKLSDRYLTAAGDVIIKITPPYTAVSINEELHHCVVPSQFTIIRCDRSLVDSDYLAMFLNTDKVKKLIALGSTGITVPMIKTGTLREIEVPIPNMDKQRSIAAIGNLIIQERHLMNELMSMKEKYYQALTEELLMEESK